MQTRTTIITAPIIITTTITIIPGGFRIVTNLAAVFSHF